MKKLYAFLSIAIIACLAFAATACNFFQSAGCTLQTAVVNTAAVAVASGLQCTNQAAIAADLTTQAAKLNLCPAGGVKSVGGDICNSLAGTLVGSLVQGAIPSAWGCSATAATGELAKLVQAGCAKAFP